MSVGLRRNNFNWLLFEKIQFGSTIRSAGNLKFNVHSVQTS